MLCNITQNSMGQTPGGVPISHNALQHYPEFHGADTWGVPCRGVPCQGVYPARGYPAWGVPCLGGYPARGTQVGYPQGQDGGTLLGGFPGRVPPRPGRGVPCWGGTLPGGTQVGQQKEYSLHGRWYAFCVHAGGLSCFFCKFIYFFLTPLLSLFHHSFIPLFLYSIY